MYRLAIAAITLAALFFVDAHAQMRHPGDTGHVAGNVKKPTPPPLEGKLGLDELRELTESAELAMVNEDYDAASRLFDTVLNAPGFAQLDTDQQHYTLISAAEVASARADFSRAQALYKRSSSLAPADSNDWMGRLNAAWFVGDHDDALASLVTIARQWPSELEYVSEWAIDALLSDARSQPGDGEFTLLQALFDSGWQTDLGLEPTQLWMRLIELLAQRDATAAAVDVASRLRDPLAIVTILSDQRFADIVAAAPDWFDVRETTDAGIIEARLAVESNPHLLAPSIVLAESLLRAGRPQDSLLVIETHLARSALKTIAGEPLEDAVAESVRALTTKAYALVALDRRSEAGEVLALAAQQTLPKQRLRDYYAVALLQARLGLSDAALATLHQVTPRDDDPQADLIRFIVARNRHDSDAANSALATLLAAKRSAGAQAQRALLIDGQLDAAADMLIARLNDPAERAPALLEIQGMQEQHWPEDALNWQALTAALMARDDVRRSVAASGATVSDYALYRWN